MQEYTGKQYLAIDIANHFGLDKDQFEDRLAWFDKHEERLEDLVDLADKPELFLAATMAYRDTQKGIPTGHLAGLDACASGPQLHACMTGCQTTALNTGLIGKKRMDLYKECTSAINRIIEDAIDIPRELVKDAQMP